MGNTIVGNSGSAGGILCGAASPGITNNIVAFNSSGIRATNGNPTLKNNCVHNPDGENYTGVTAGASDIQVDPGLVAAQYGQLHLQLGSPCIDTGYTSTMASSRVDVDGQARPLNGIHDIGADESDGTAYAYAPVTVRVSASGSDSNDGSSWSLAKRTVQSAIDTASSLGGEVWVASGTYAENITLPPYVYLYGSFAGTESARSERDASARTTILDGGRSGSVVYMVAGYRLASIDGFVLRNGKSLRGGGIYCDAGSPTLSNLVITENSASGGGGLYARLCYEMRVSGCTITANKATTWGGGAFIWASIGAISNCAITGNSGRYGGGVYCDNSHLSLRNNTIAANTATDGGGIYSTLADPEITNNVIALNSSGIVQVNVGSPVMQNNCVYNPAGYNYSNVSPGTGDISLDPQFLAPWAVDYRLRPGSPCIATGDNSVVETGSIDLEGKARILPVGGTADMGCYEYDGAPYAMRGVGQAKAVPGQFDVELRAKPITAVFPGAFYVEDPDRNSGIKVLSSQSVNRGDLATFTGHSILEEGERVLQASSVTVTPGTTADVPGALFVRNCSVGGGPLFWNENGEARGQEGIAGASGLNNIGLLVRSFGRIVEIEEAIAPAAPTWFKIDDGTSVNLKCTIPSGVTINPSWHHAAVTGISSCEKIGQTLTRLIRVRDASDITGY